MRKKWIVLSVFLVLAGAMICLSMIFASWTLIRMRSVSPDEKQELGTLEKQFREAGYQKPGIAANIALDVDVHADDLIRALHNPDGNIRCGAAMVLGLRAEKQAVPDLLEYVPRHKQTSRPCIWALGRIQDLKAVPLLINRLDAWTQQINQVASQERPSEDGRPIGVTSRMLKQGILLDLGEGEVIEALGNLGDARAAEVLLARLKACRYDTYDGPRLACENALSQLGPVIVPLLITALESSQHITITQSLFRVLGRIADPRGAAPIVAQIRQKAARPHMHRQWPWADAYVALARIGTPEAVAYLDEFAGSKQVIEREMKPDNRQTSIEASLQDGVPISERDVNWLMLQVQFAKRPYRTASAAARELGRRKSPEATTILENSLKTIICGHYSTGTTSEYAPDYAASFAYVVPLAYARCDADRTVPLLTIAMRAPHNWHVQVGAAEALGELGDRRAVEVLVRALGDKAWPVQQAAATALGRIGDPAAIAALEERSTWGDFRVRQAAREAIVAIQADQAAAAAAASLAD